MGATPAHNYSDYLKVATIKETKEVTDGTKSVELILSSFKVVIDLQRDLLDITDKAGDEGTNSQMSDYITEQEKEVWMYNSYLGK
ncbi:DNA protection during starvation protein [Chryseobacterium sp. Bi04]|nr:DNA protection during starvation protein [Chryseobacterium sp. Bi04]